MLFAIESLKSVFFGSNSAHDVPEVKGADFIDVAIVDGNLPLPGTDGFS